MPDTTIYWDDENELFSFTPFSGGVIVADDDTSYPDRQLHLWKTFEEASAFCCGLDVHQGDDDGYVIGITPEGVPAVLLWTATEDGPMLREDHR